MLNLLQDVQAVCLEAVFVMAHSIMKCRLSEHLASEAAGNACVPAVERESRIKQEQASEIRSEAR